MVENVKQSTIQSTLAQDIAELHEKDSVFSPARVELAADAVAKVRNYHYIFYLTAAVSLLNALFLVVDFISLPSGSFLQKIYLLLHGITAALMLGIFIYIKLKKQKYLSNRFVFFGSLFILCVGISFSAVDQLSSNTITPYLVSTMIISAFLYVKKRDGILLQTIGFILFIGIIVLLQKQRTIVVSHLVNGFQVYILALIIEIFRANSLRREVGYSLMSSGLADTVSDYSMKAYHLTEREREIFNLLLLGTSNKEISENLSISVATVKTHVTNIFRKLKVKTRGQMMNLFYKG